MNQRKTLLVKCQTCDREFNKKPSEVKRTTSHYCSSGCINDTTLVKVTIEDDEIKKWLRKRLVESGHFYTEIGDLFEWAESVDRSPLPPPLTESQEEELKLILTVFYRNEEI